MKTNSIGFTGIATKLFKEENDRRYKEVYSHELAHKSAAGGLAGSIVIEKNAQGLVVGGHVPIKMPGLNKANPSDTIEKAQRVINAALAPSDPSGQDRKVAAQAKSILNAAKQELNDKKTGKKLDLKA